MSRASVYNVIAVNQYTSQDVMNGAS